MIKNKRRLLMSWAMALVMLLDVVFPCGIAYADTAGPAADKTSVLTNVSAEVSQNGTPITGTTLPSADNLSVAVSFGVPVAGDYPDENPVTSPVVQQGDTADIPLGKGFTLSAASGGLPIALTAADQTVIGHVTAFQTDSETKNVTAHVIFDGAAMSEADISGIRAGFHADLQVNSDGGQDGSGHTLFTILDKTYTIVPPAAPTTYTVQKTGTADLANKCINWTVAVTAAQGSTNLDLDGCTFSDDLTNVGAYVSGSFKVGPSSGELTKPTQDLTGPKLSYAFPSGSTSPQKITFSTTIPDAKYYAGTQQTLSNTARLLDGTTELAEGSGSVSFTPTWITKEGKVNYNGSLGVYSPTVRTVTWTITANQMGATLPDAYITDLLPAGLTLVSAKAQIESGSDWIDMNPAREWSSAPADGNYQLGTISAPILLTIVTSVPDAAYAAGITHYQNSAKIGWTGGPVNGIGSTPAGVGVGYNAIRKTGVLDSKTGIVTWTVTVDTGSETIPNLAVYDLLAYGENSAALTGAAGIPDGVTAQCNQQYIVGSFHVTSQSDGSAPTIANTPIQNGGTTAADLLKITGFADNAPNKAAFTFQTQVVNPEIYAGNGTNTVYNTATLFSANAKLNEATAPVSYPSHMLAKELLQRGADPTKAEEVNGKKTTDAAEGFDYVDKSVIFRLSVNADGMDLTNLPADAQGTKLGGVTVTDTLPAGWVFDKIDGSKDFLIYAGSVGEDKSVTATGGALTDTGFVTSDFTGTTNGGTQNTATFTFGDLKAPYVILVKARPTAETAAGYFDKNQSATVTNGLNLKAENWTPGVTATQNVKIDSTVLSKNLDASQAASQAYLTWTVDYKPYELNGKGTRIVDTLPEGIDLRTDSSGNLALADKDGNANLAISELTLQTDGSYTVGAPVAPVVGTNVSYDSAGRALTFRIPDPAKAYRFTYVTDITGNSGSITNQVKLYGSDAGEIDTGKSYTIVEQSGWATLQRGGSLTITKTDQAGGALSGAEFTLYALSGAAVIRRGTTDSNGTLKMRAIPVGSYLLRETKIPAGYLSENVSAVPADHAVSVAVNGSAVTTSVDGKSGTGSNVLAVRNYRSGTAGNLTISKTVAGNAGDQKKAFTFTLTLTGAPDTYSYTGNGVPNGTIQSGGTVSLASGQSVTVIGLPKGASYTVTETDYSADGYSTVSTVTAAKTVGANSTAAGAAAAGTIVADDTQIAAFTNTKNVYAPAAGNLTISKTVAGAGADTAKAFLFTVTFTGAPGAYPYTGNGVPDGTVQSGGTVSLANGQSVTITGLPAGAGYRVSEDAASAQGYAVKSVGSSGSIAAGESRTAAFTNTKISNPGSLTIRKTVTGRGASLTRKFQFTVTLTGAPDAYPYTGSASGTLRSGGTVTLSSGQHITITGLPAGAGYTVTEADYTGVGYTASSTGAAGTIPDGGTRTAAFTNRWSPLPNKPGKPANPTTDIGDEGIPTGTVDGGGNGGGNGGGSGAGGSVMPKTGDSRTGDLAKLGLLFSSAALAALSTVDFALRRKRRSGKRTRK